MSAFNQPVARIVSCYERLGTALFSDGMWPCDVGAVVLAELADRLQLERAVVTGTYRHATRAGYLAATGATHAHPEADGSYHEHHTWAVVGHGPDALLLDPNGALRCERQVQPLAATTDRYVPFVPDSPWIELPAQITTAELVAAGWDSRLTAAMARLPAFIHLLSTGNIDP